MSVVTELAQRVGGVPLEPAVPKAAWLAFGSTLNTCADYARPGRGISASKPWRSGCMATISGEGAAVQQLWGKLTAPAQPSATGQAGGRNVKNYLW